MTIETLSDDILLEIFDFYMNGPMLEDEDRDDLVDRWLTLVHVCQIWRNVVFASPHRLRLQLLCTPTRSVREMLNIWPELPIIIKDYGDPKTVEDIDNVIAALELNDRVSQIFLWDASWSELEIFAAMMQGPFPALTYLWLQSTDQISPVISDSFLGGSAPRLDVLLLEGIQVPIPALLEILSSAPNLSHLHLWDVPHTGYISPEVMVTCISMLTRLKSLTLRSQSPRSRPDGVRRLPPPPTRTILPALTRLHFAGDTEYLEDLVVQIDIPLLESISMTFFNHVVFDILELPRFLRRTKTFTGLDQAKVSFYERSISVELSRQSGADTARLKLAISCRDLDWQISSLAQVCNLALPTLSALEHLSLGPNTDGPGLDLVPGQDDVENNQWLDFLRPFTKVKNLHLSKQVAPCVAPALKELTGERVTEVLPTLQNVFLDGFEVSRPVEEAIEQFVAARQLSGCPIAIHH